MSWTTTLSFQLKNYLDPTNDDYTEAFLSKFIAFAATEVFQKLSLKNTYSIDIAVPSITPDPTLDMGLSSLLVLKAAEIVIRHELKQAVISAGYSIKDDRVSISGTEALKALKDLLLEFQKNYAQAEFAYIRGDATIGRAILSPYTSH